MRDEAELTDGPRLPRWLQQTRPLEVGAGILVLVDAVVELVRIFLTGASPVVLLGLILCVVGAAGARKWPWPGLVVTALGVVVTGAVGWPPLVEYSIAVFTLFVFALQGHPPIRGTLVVAALIYLGVVLAEGSPLSPSALAGVVSALAGGALGFAVRAQRRFWRSMEQRAQDAVA
ncbi:MAG: histidine kinase, partial [Frondihabitans sp.]|nr:histidine kinase [Frondihabitans sp.]